MMKPYRGTSQPPSSKQSSQRSNQLAFDDFSSKMFRGMDDDFGMGFGSLMPRFGGFDEIERQMMDFSDMHHKMMRGGNSGNANGGAIQMVSKSYVQSSKMGPNGQMITEKYFDNNAVAKGHGNTVSERQQGYKNSGTGVDKFAQEKMLNDKGRKYIKEREKGGPAAITNHYYNIEEGYIAGNQQFYLIDEAQDFDSQWDSYKRNIGLMNPSKMIEQKGGQNKIMYGNEKEFPTPKGYQRQSSENIQSLGWGRRGSTQQDLINQNFKADLQPTQGGRQQFALPNSTIQQPIPLGGGQTNLQHFQQQAPQRAQQAGRIGGKNEDLTGVYRNKFQGRGNFPQAG